jgi:predicted dehydrogenase
MRNRACDTVGASHFCPRAATSWSRSLFPRSSTILMQSPVPSKRFRVALLGTGVIAVPHAAALKSLPDIELIAGCDLDEQKGRAFQQQVNAAHCFQDLKTMLDRVSPDVVHVLLPPAAHAQAAELCLAAGSHVLVEKPFCISSEECRMVQKAAERAERQVGSTTTSLTCPDFSRCCIIFALAASEPWSM